MRNVERTDDPAAAQGRHAHRQPRPGEAEDYLHILAGQTCYLQHLSEGVDNTRAGSIACAWPSGDWALTPAFSGIHSAALSRRTSGIIADHGGSVVWSPLSNYLLYGETLDRRPRRPAC